ncbi:unnamed protein product [Ixodes persulcatus]
MPFLRLEPAPPKIATILDSPAFKSAPFNISKCRIAFLVKLTLIKNEACHNRRVGLVGRMPNTSAASSTGHETQLWTTQTTMKNESQEAGERIPRRFENSAAAKALKTTTKINNTKGGHGDTTRHDVACLEG